MHGRDNDLGPSQRPPVKRGVINEWQFIALLIAGDLAAHKAVDTCNRPGRQAIIISAIGNIQVPKTRDDGVRRRDDATTEQELCTFSSLLL